MKIRPTKWLKHLFFAMLSALLLSNLSGCGLGLNKLEFHSTETVKSYLEETFPGKTITLSPTYEEDKYTRSWTFTLSDYPGYTFQVCSFKRGDMLPFLYNIVILRNNAYATVSEQVLKNFVKSMPNKLDEHTAKLWDGVSWASFSKNGFKEDKDEPPNLTVTLKLENYQDLPLAKNLMNTTYDYLHQTAPELSDIAFEMVMPLDKRYLVYGHYWEDDIDFGSIYDKVTYLKTSLWSQEDVQRSIERARYSMMRYYILMGEVGNGITEAMKTDFAKTHYELGKDGIYYLPGEESNYLAQLWLKTDKRYLIAQRTSNGQLYLTLPEAYLIFCDEGLSIKGNPEKCTVIGKDGEKYQLNYQDEIEGSGAEPNNMFYIPITLVEKITGKNLKDYVMRKEVH